MNIEELLDRLPDRTTILLVRTAAVLVAAVCLISLGAALHDAFDVH